MIKTFIDNIQKQISDHRRYRRAIAEIDSMTVNDLVDIRGDWAEMRQQVWQDIYGSRA